MNDDTLQQAAQSAGGSGDGLGLLMMGKTAVSLLIVVAIILGCAWLLKRVGPNRRAGAQHLRVIASTPVGQRERVVIVEVDNRWLVLGVGGGQVNKLDTLEPPPTPTKSGPATHSASPLSGSFASRFGQALKRNANDSLGRSKSRRRDDGNDSQ